MCSAKDYARPPPRLKRFLPARCAQTPAITGLQSRKAEFRDRRREIIAARLRILKKSRGHDRAHRVAADILAAGVAEAVAKETGHRAQRADFESIAEHVLGLVAFAAALASVISQHRDSLHRYPSPASRMSIAFEIANLAISRRLSIVSDVCRGDSFVECREDAPFTDGGGDAVAVHVGPQVVVYAAKDHADLLAFEILEEFEQGLGSGVVDVGDGACIDDEAMNGRRRVRHERAYLVGKAVLVGVEQIRAEAIDDDAGFRHRAGSGGYGDPSASGLGRE